MNSSSDNKGIQLQQNREVPDIGSMAPKDAYKTYIRRAQASVNQASSEQEFIDDLEYIISCAINRVMRTEVPKTCQGLLLKFKCGHSRLHFKILHSDPCSGHEDLTITSRIFLPRFLVNIAYTCHDCFKERAQAVESSDIKKTSDGFPSWNHTSLKQADMKARSQHQNGTPSSDMSVQADLERRSERLLEIRANWFEKEQDQPKSASKSQESGASQVTIEIPVPTERGSKPDAVLVVLNSDDKDLSEKKSGKKSANTVKSTAKVYLKGSLEKETEVEDQFVLVEYPSKVEVNHSDDEWEEVNADA